jgi:hypothetical protein
MKIKVKRSLNLSLFILEMGQSNSVLKRIILYQKAIGFQLAKSTFKLAQTMEIQ